MADGIKIVVGSGAGDEGKGLLTDYFSDSGTMVVRANGGAQAGHTVQTDDYRHVFHHFGSGTLQGAKTFLSHFFITNPYVFDKEYQLLTEHGYNPVVYYDSKVMLTTPWDMMINQMAEEFRGDHRHGSCGLGINETVKRHAMYRHTNVSMIDQHNFYHQLRDIRDNYVFARIDTIGIPLSDVWRSRIYNSAVLDEYITLCKLMKSRIIDYFTDVECRIIDYFTDVESRRDVGIFFERHQNNVVFENAQGLLLDRDHRNYPHVTPSKTGLSNPSQLLNYCDFKRGYDPHIEVVYVTRAYATRHGAGPFPNEDKNLSYEDKTNVPNMWQQSLRFGCLNLDFLAREIGDDFDNYGRVGMKKCLAVTCLDQVGEEVTYIMNRNKMTTSREEFLRNMASRTGTMVKYTSYGPTRNDVKQIAD